MSENPSMSDISRPANRLARESSPYLRQHADNPVDWWPWCDEAFAEARARLQVPAPVRESLFFAICLVFVFLGLRRNSRTV